MLPGSTETLGSFAFLPLKLCRALAVSRKQEGRFPEAWHSESPLAPGTTTLAKEEARVMAVPGGRQFTGEY